MTMSKRHAKKYRGIARIHLRSNHTCFYTGLECRLKGKKDTHFASIEHLLSIASFSGQSRDRMYQRNIHKRRIGDMLSKFNKQNLVTATRWMNCVVGDAPLTVKYALRDHLHSIILLPGLTLGQERKLYTRLAIKFLKTYCPKDTGWNYPWNWHADNFIDERAVRKRKILKEMFMELLTDEEKYLLSC